MPESAVFVSSDRPVSLSNPGLWWAWTKGIAVSLAGIDLNGNDGH